MLALVFMIWALFKELMTTNRDRSPSPDPGRDSVSPRPNGHAVGLSGSPSRELGSPGLESGHHPPSSPGSPAPSPDDGPSYHRMRKSRENSDFSTVSSFTTSSNSGSAVTTGSYGSAPSGTEEPHRRYCRVNNNRARDILRHLYPGRDCSAYYTHNHYTLFGFLIGT